MPFVEPPLDIWMAARQGLLAEVQRFVADGVDPNAEQRGQITPLHEATKAGHLVLVEWLLEHGADPNARTLPNPGERGSCSPLHLAVESGKSQLVKLLLSHRAKINAKMSDGTTPLILAADAVRGLGST